MVTTPHSRLSLKKTNICFGKTFGRAAMIGVSALVLAACNPSIEFNERHLKQLSNSTKNRLETLKMKPGAPMVVRIFKEEAKLEVWKKRKVDGKYALFKKYDICAYSGKLGPKIKEGDRQAPEGFYTITPGLMNPKSNYYLAFNLGFPNAFDKAHKRTGSHLMVHGSCSSRGCYAMEDDKIEEIYQLARESFNAGAPSFQVQAFPFRMTDKNLKRHANDKHIKFWRMLKQGSDHFEALKRPPQINVCEKKYLFNVVATDGQPFIADEECPAYAMPQSIAMAYAKHRGETYVPQTPILAKAPLPVAMSVRTNPQPTTVFTQASNNASTAALPAPNPDSEGILAPMPPGPIWVEPEPKRGFFSKLFRR